MDFFFILIITNIYLQFPKFLHLFFALVASLHITQVFIIVLIKTFYSLHTLIFKREKFEVRNSPLNRYATLLSQALYCIKVGCTATGTGATFIAGGMAYDAVLVEAGRERVFLPMMGQVYKGVFGEVLPHNSKNTPFKTPVLTEHKPTAQELNVVSDMITKYESLSPSDRLEFMTEINKSCEK